MRGRQGRRRWDGRADHSIGTQLLQCAAASLGRKVGFCPAARAQSLTGRPRGLPAVSAGLPPAPRTPGGMLGPRLLPAVIVEFSGSGDEAVEVL